MGFSDVQVMDTAIYAAFQGDTFEEISRKMQKGDMTDGGRYVYVFSLEGEPLRKYGLDHVVYSVFIDKLDKIIIAMDVNMDSPILLFSS